MAEWTLAYEGFDPRQEGLREALCTLGNGYFATRGAAPEAEADDIHYPGTYLAGGYNRLVTEIAGRQVENEDLVNFPNWLPLGIRLDGTWFNPLAVELLAYRQELDLRRGLLRRSLRFRLKDGRITGLEQRRLVHMDNPHLAALETTLTAENWEGPATLRSALDGRVVNAGVERYKALNSKHLQPLETRAVDAETVFLKVQTRQSELRLAQAARTRLYADGHPLEPQRRLLEDEGYIAQEFDAHLARGRPLTVEKVVALHTARDQAISECGLAARETLARAGGFEDLLIGHARAWETLWNRFDTHGEGNDPAAVARGACILRLHVFHLLQTVSIHSTELDVGVPARGWHGEAYRGHIFWDELFIFPLLNLRIPEITRALLLYRYRRLDAARTLARERGFRGACFPWQSGSDGREETQKVHLNPRSGRWLPDHSQLQYHVNAAIAYNVWQYYQVTRDREFLSYHGAEMLLEIARFWADVARYNETLDRYEILGVMGPDEFHEAYPGADAPGLDNNAYTNLMAVWVLCRALEVLDLLPERRRRELRERLALGDGELDRWQAVSRRMRVVFHGDGLLSQFQGYEDLEELDWDAYREKYGDIHRLDRILEAEGDSPNRYKLSKQADVLMLLYLFSAGELEQILNRLGYPFDRDAIPRLIDYYLHRTAHGSTLSGVVSSWILARSERARSWQFFLEALESDVSDVQGGTTPEGIHLGAMAGTVDLVQRAYTGIHTHDDVLWLNPALPRELRWISLRLQYRGHGLELRISHERVVVQSLNGECGPIRVGWGGRVMELAGGGRLEFEAKG